MLPFYIDRARDESAARRFYLVRLLKVPRLGKCTQNINRDPPYEPNILQYRLFCQPVSPAIGGESRDSVTPLFANRPTNRTGADRVGTEADPLARTSSKLENAIRI